MERDQASKFINDLLKLMVSRNGSDLFITGDFPPAIKVDGKVTKVSPQPLNGGHTLALARSIMNDKQAAEFERTKECNFAISPPGIGRFRVNAFVQQGKVGMVLRVIPQVLPTIDGLGVPQVLKEVVMAKRGLVILVGATGSGKSTTLAAMIDWRNENSGYYRSIHVSYPNERDRERAEELGVHPGGDIMIHGLPSGEGWIGAAHAGMDWTRGCIAVTDREMDEIWELVDDGTPIEIRP